MILYITLVLCAALAGLLEGLTLSFVPPTTIPKIFLIGVAFL
jgi:hypothetical protein